MLDYMTQWNKWVHRKVRKKDGSLFRSGYTQNTVTNVKVSTLGFVRRAVFTFLEDSTEVQCDYCELVSPPE